MPAQRADEDRARIAVSAVPQDVEIQPDRRRATDRLYAGALVADRLMDRWTWKRLTELLDYREPLRPTVAQWCEFAGYWAGELGELEDMGRLAYLYAERYGVTAARWYDHRKAAQHLGLVRQLQAAAPEQRALWRLSFPTALVEPGAILSPSSLPDDLADHLGFMAPEFVFDYDDQEFEDAFLLPRNSAEQFEVRREHGVTRVPPAVDPAAAADMRMLTVGEWIGESYVVASAIRAERELFEASGIGELFDADAAEARVRTRLEYPEYGIEDDGLDYVDAAEEALLTARVDDPGQQAKLQLTQHQEQQSLLNPETSPYSSEGIASICYVAVRKYWAQRNDGEEQKAAATQQGVGPAERKRAAQLMRSHVWWHWVVWREKHEGYKAAPPISPGQWHDLTTAVAYALRRTTAGEVIALCTESLGSARDLISTVAWRLWQLNRSMPEYREWHAYRRAQLQAAAPPGWTLPPSPSVIGPASARAQVRRAQGGRAEIGRQLQLDLAAPAASAKAVRTRETLVSAALERDIRRRAVEAEALPSKRTEDEEQALREKAQAARTCETDEQRTARNTANTQRRLAKILASRGISA